MFTKVQDSIVVQLPRFNDERGFFEELYSLSKLPNFSCMQVNCSRSKKNVLRGMHIVPFAKLVHCVKGKIFDVVVDMRKDSETHLQWHGVELNEDNQLSLYIPHNCAHGFLALEESIVVYAQDGLYDPTTEYSVHYSSLGIEWPGTDFIVSEKDAKARTLYGQWQSLLLPSSR
jgi:dTDP-4-dehydrorhamnose 3,5-epimerase